MGFDLLSNIPRPFVLDRHRNEPHPPTWMLRSLPSRVFLALQERHQDGATAQTLAAFVEVALVGWQGVTRDGMPFEFQPGGERFVLDGIKVEGGAAAAIVDAIPVEIIAELATEILKRNQLDKGNAGN